MSLQRGFHTLDFKTGEVSLIHDPEPGMAANRLNDGKVDRAVSKRRTFAPVDTSGEGAADGATVDAEGYLWSALVYDGKLVRYAPDGSVERVISMPVKKVTSVMFGGPNLDVLFVTSMAKPPLPRLPGDGPLRGSLFAIHDFGIRGLPELRFAA